MADSTQQKLGRVRPPRVQITYDVETGGAIEKKELPFIVGIMADLSGKPAEALAPVKDRKFVEIDRDNFNDVLASAAPRLALRVPNRLVKDSDEQLGIELNFTHMDDFSPVEVMEQVPALKALMDARKRLRDLLTKLDGNDELDSLLSQVVRNTEDQAELKKQLGSPE
ncbi:type VI secretion system contractile sheath small subunit [Niveispirillum irakense]|uniref:type VI secretion system contractile sheath small subunit n=1 Tax=Niveispirillum irakense TaxID=34011 RepID=UPI0003FC0501|nr:type VI secretion system contractile sheath small subunit [Niveispirillum irakense]